MQRDFNRFGGPVDTKIGDLKPSSRAVNVLAKIVSKSDPKDVSSGRDGTSHRVSDALVCDETGCVYLTLWDDDVDKVNVDDTISIKNGYVNLFRGHMRLNVGRFGTLEKSETPFEGELKTDNNVSEKFFEDNRGPRRSGGRGGFRRF